MISEPNHPTALISVGSEPSLLIRDASNISLKLDPEAYRE